MMMVLYYNSKLVHPSNRKLNNTKVAPSGAIFLIKYSVDNIKEQSIDLGFSRSSPAEGESSC